MACLVEYPAIDFLNAITERYFQDLSRFKDSVSSLQVKYGEVLREKDALQIKVNNLTKTQEELKAQLKAAVKQTFPLKDIVPRQVKKDKEIQLQESDFSHDPMQNECDSNTSEQPILMLQITDDDDDEKVCVVQQKPSQVNCDKVLEDNFFLENPSYLDKFIRQHVTKEQLQHWLEEKTRVAVVIDKGCMPCNSHDRNNRNSEMSLKEELVDQSKISQAYEWTPQPVEERLAVTEGRLLLHQSNASFYIADGKTRSSTEGQEWPRPTPVQKRTLALGGEVKIPADRDPNTTCRLCGKEFSSPSVRNRHMLSHSGQRPHKCEICGKGFILASHLKGHLGTHFKKEVFKCRRCQIEFKSAAALENHMQTHKVERRYSCEICDKKFLQVSHLKKHSLIHSGVRPYKCDFCGNQYTEAGSLKRHIRMHTGEKPYSCTICGRSFTFASNMRAHEKRHMDEKYGIDDGRELSEPEQEPEHSEEERVEAEERLEMDEAKYPLEQ